MQIFDEFKSAERVIHYFLEISKIPHGSGNTDKIADYLENFARKHALYSVRDEKNNVIIKKSGSAGYEDREPIIIQGHSDMVIAAERDCNRDLENEGISVYRDGDFLRADGTTLGGDDGVALAYALALLEATDIHHPPIEAIFTSDEEIGLLGAYALDTKILSGKRMINIDMAKEGVFTAGCAGGLCIDVILPMKREPMERYAFSLSLSGLRGGHSGSNINCGRENAIKILGEILKSLHSASPVRIHSLLGGDADNAIPRAFELIFSSECNDKDKIIEDVRKVCAAYKESEPEIAFSIKDAPSTVGFFKEEDTSRLISLIYDTPNGVIAMSEDIPNLVETSLNLGLIESDEAGTTLTFSIRSSKDEEIQKVVHKIIPIATAVYSTYTEKGGYPGWEFKKDSRLRDVMCEVYRRRYGKDASVISIHAGLECGILSKKIAGLDCVSIGPDIFAIHTTKEHLSLPSLQRVWDFLKEVLSEL